MSFYDVIQKYKNFDFQKYLNSVTPQKIENILNKDKISQLDFLALLSPASNLYLEQMAQKAHIITKKNFGNVIFIFTPLYISDYCDNSCPYCSFARQHRITRNHLSLDKIKEEAEAIAQTGMRHILVLTGESRTVATVDYLTKAVSLLSGIFSFVAIEVYPMLEEEYSEMVKCGAEGLTIYQEVYNEKRYHELHRGGPKENYLFRLDAPQRGAKAQMRSVTVGCLLGLYEATSEVFFAALHAEYLQKSFPSLEISLAFPRLRPMVRNFPAYCEVSDREYVKFIVATRIFLPRCGITVSTREKKELRNSLARLGVTRMSAGVSTAVGGHKISFSSTPQFEIADTRTLEQMKNDLIAMGLQPVLHDWNTKYFATNFNK